jgi:hypothetical protein
MMMYSLIGFMILASAQVLDRRHLSPIKYRIIVFGWRRRASLVRLLNSLEAADYDGRMDIPIEIFLDGGAHPQVVDCVENFRWSHGQVMIHQRDVRIGLEKSIIGAWSPQKNDEEIGILFEDDIEASPLYFRFISILMKYYGENNENCAGISLNTPRYREIIKPFSKWVPDDSIPKEAKLLFNST